jgi:hypothetical protein
MHTSVGFRRYKSPYHDVGIMLAFNRLIAIENSDKPLINNHSLDQSQS